MSDIIFQYFKKISSIPRGSGNEKEISDYMVSFAQDLGLEVIQDKVGNIIIKKGPSSGYEDAPTVILQGHLDMVCEKESHIDHDFEKDPLDLYIDGDLIKARGTTLGADNGMAIAYQMAILAADNLEHPPLEILMTIDEERGMTGVANMHPEYLDGKILINLDSETEGEFLVSCAGGARSQLELEYDKEEPDRDLEFYQLSINGLKGGHSGMEIHLDRANSNILMGRLLKELNKNINLQLSMIEGGSKDNVITRETKAVIGIPKDKEKILEDIILEYKEIFKEEYRVQDPGIDIHVDKTSIKDIEFVFPQDIKENIISILTLHPNGVQAMSKDMKGLVETSLNLGVVQTRDNKLIFSSAIRSSLPSRKELVANKVETLAKLTGAEYIRSADYPAWVYEPNSPIRDKAIDVYQQMYNKKPKINAIHAGLECGFISEKLPGVDMISFGPNIQGAHTPEESLSISSAKNVWEFLKELLKNIK